jgi:hypothetical protein
MSTAGGPKDRRRAFEKELLGQLWEGEVDAAVELLRGALEWVRTPKAVEELIGYLEARRGYIPDSQERQRAGLWIASTRVEKFVRRVIRCRIPHSMRRILGQLNLGHPAYHEIPKGRRDHSMPEKRRQTRSASQTLRKARVAWSRLHSLKPSPGWEIPRPFTLGWIP